jgi:hypothetical protein
MFVFVSSFVLCLLVSFFLSVLYQFENRPKDQGLKLLTPAVCACDRPAEHKVL